MTPGSRQQSWLGALILWWLFSSAGAAEIMLGSADVRALDYAPQRDELVLGLLGQLWLLPGQGGAAAPLTPAGLQLQSPRWSPDGSRIVASGGWESSDQHLWMVDAANGTVMQLTNGAWQDSAPVWRPDGQAIVFVSDRGGSQDLWQLTLASSATVSLVRSTAALGQPFFAGDQLWFVADADGQYALQTRESNGRFQTPYLSETPIIAPSGQRNGLAVTWYAPLVRASFQLNVLLTRPVAVVKRIGEPRSGTPPSPAWRDRQRYYSITDGELTLHELAGERRQPVPMTAWLSVP
ncbi:MAG: hypothetical protein AAGF46_06865, partial [Pseudomonadota bacterium]